MEKHKFLKTIYDIQKNFGVDFAGVSRTFSFGLKPNKEEKEKLENWFEQVNRHKKRIYGEIYDSFKKNPQQYLAAKFDYNTFFKGKSLSLENNEIITSEPVMEGLRMEISGAMRSFRTNYERIFGENQKDADSISKLVKESAEKIKNKNLDFAYDEERLTNKLKEFFGMKYAEIIKNYDSYCNLKQTVQKINALIGDYNYEVNQLNQSHKRLELTNPPRLKNCPRFPIIEKEKELKTNVAEQNKTYKQLLALAKDSPKQILVLEWLKKISQKALKEKGRIKIISFEKRLAYWINNKLQRGVFDEASGVKEFIKRLEENLYARARRFEDNPYDGQNRNSYFNLLSLRARFAHPEKDINTLRSQLVGSYLRGEAEKEIITLPGFSWEKDEHGKPLKNVAFAFQNNQLCICIAASKKPFKIEDDGKLNFVKTTGGSRQMAKRQKKSIEYVRGNFDMREEGAPVFFPLHFGKSHARRYIYNKYWGVFSQNPQVFLNNARLKREKLNPGDEWQYFVDITLSGERIYGLKEFSKAILKRADTVIGVDRGEINPIAFSVIDKNENIKQQGILGKKEYIDKLKEYDQRKREQQAKGKKISKSLRLKISRLQKTALETAISQILFLVAQYKSVIVIEDLSRKFFGREQSVIPKKTYNKIEDLLGNALNFAGLVRSPGKGSGPIRITKNNKLLPNIKYWGNFMAVNPAGTSQTCLKCNTSWNKEKYDKIYAYSQSKNFQNIDFASATLEYENKELTLNKEWLEYSKAKPFGEKRTLHDLQVALQRKSENETDEVKKLFRKAVSHRPRQERFICHNCGFEENADIVGATNIARRGLEILKRLLTTKH